MCMVDREGFFHILMLTFIHNEMTRGSIVKRFLQYAELKQK